jgi:hypothetical protein
LFKLSADVTAKIEPMLAMMTPSVGIDVSVC